MEYALRLSPCSEYAVIRQLRKHVGFYVAGLPRASAIRRMINQCETRKQVQEVLDRLTSSEA